MRVHVKFFAIFREMVGVKTEWTEVADDTTVESLWKQYAARSARLDGIRAAYAVNKKLAKPDQVLQDGDEVGFLPPVSGGAERLDHENARKVRKPRKKTTRSVISSGATRSVPVLPRKISRTPALAGGARENGSK